MPLHDAFRDPLLRHLEGRYGRDLADSWAHL
jgi:hypothetical protein